MENVNLQLEAKRFFEISGIEFWKINNSFMYPNVVIFYGDPEVEGRLDVRHRT